MSFLDDIFFPKSKDNVVRAPVPPIPWTHEQMSNMTWREFLDGMCDKANELDALGKKMERLIERTEHQQRYDEWKTLCE